jgi:hypothetical protein
MEMLIVEERMFEEQLGTLCTVFGNGLGWKRDVVWRAVRYIGKVNERPTATKTD